MSIGLGPCYLQKLGIRQSTVKAHGQDKSYTVVDHFYLLY
jgi:hypothetical protein